MKKRYMIAPVVACLIAAPAVFNAQKATAPPQMSYDTAVNRNLIIFNELVRQLENTYVDSIRPGEAFDAAIGAMLNTVDPYTEYYNSEQKEQLMQMTTGVYGGIGCMVLTKDGNTYFSTPLKDSPAYKAGIKAGDRILRVDTIDMAGKSHDFTTKHLRGEPGTPVRVTVQRPYSTDSIITFDIVRDRLREASVPYYGVVGGNTGYIYLTSFMENSADEVKAALDSFKNNPAVSSLVLDLRGNGGGLVESAINILGNFLPKDTEVLQTKGKEKGSVKTYRTTRTPLFPDLPMAVLIDGGTASASEITAGALQDLDRAVLIGNRSFGKGLVQSTYQLPYDGLLKVTTAKYYIPSGRLIQALDYSHRNPDGSVARTPDSLTNEFKTSRGRVVRDGGGLVPDTTVALRDYSRLLYNLIQTNQFFDYATKYAAEHPEIAPPGEFTVTDEIFEDFVASVDTAKVKTDKIGKLMTDDMRKTARIEGYMTDSLASALDALDVLMQPTLKDILYNRKEEVKQFLGREIVSRYYLEAGEDEYMLRFDDDLAAALQILGDPAKYQKILHIQNSPKAEKAKAPKAKKGKGKK